MKNINLSSPNGKFKILLGEMEEYSMAGCYACPISIQKLNEKPVLLPAKCSGEVIWQTDNETVFFVHMNVERRHQWAIYNVNSQELRFSKLNYPAISLISLTKKKFTFWDNGWKWPRERTKVVIDLALLQAATDSVVFFPPSIPAYWRTNFNNFHKALTVNELEERNDSILAVCLFDYVVDFGHYSDINGRFFSVMVSIGDFNNNDFIENSKFTNVGDALKRLNECLEILSSPNAPLTDLHLKAIEIRCKNAQKGNWFSWIEGRDMTSGSSMIMTGVQNLDNIWDSNRGEDIYLTDATLADIDFIANARQDIPTLLEEIKRLQTENALLKSRKSITKRDK
jgi:hypothetical protein